MVAYLTPIPNFFWMLGLICSTVTFLQVLLIGQQLAVVACGTNEFSSFATEFKALSSLKVKSDAAELFAFLLPYKEPYL